MSFDFEINEIQFPVVKKKLVQEKFLILLIMSY